MTRFWENCPYPYCRDERECQDPWWGDCAHRPWLLGLRAAVALYQHAI